MEQQQLLSLAEDYALKPRAPPRSPPSPPSSQIVASGTPEELKKEVAQGDANNQIREGTPEEVKLTTSDYIEGVKLEEEQADSNGGEGEEEECGFCLFMKGGGCKENFIAWEKCVDESESNKDDLVEKCYEVTGLLRKCMEEHADYYEPILRAEKALKQEVAQQLEQDRVATSDAVATTAATAAAAVAAATAD